MIGTKEHSLQKFATTTIDDTTSITFHSPHPFHSLAIAFISHFIYHPFHLSNMSASNSPTPTNSKKRSRDALDERTAENERTTDGHTVENEHVFDDKHTDDVSKEEDPSEDHPEGEDRDEEEHNVRIGYLCACVCLYKLFHTLMVDLIFLVIFLIYLHVSGLQQETTCC